MNCPHCGSPIGLEDEYCSYCGKINEFALEHNKQMHHYQNEFLKTQQQVEDSAKRFSRLSGPLISLVILIIANIAAFIFLISSWNISSSIESRQILKQEALHRDNLNMYLEQKEYQKFSAYYDRYSLYMVEEFRYYNAVKYTIDDYYYVYNSIMNPYEYDQDEESIQSTLTILTRQLSEIYHPEDSYSYDKDKYFSDENMKVISDIQERTKVLLLTYTDLTEEQVNAIPDSSSSIIQNYLKEGLNQ